MRRRIAGLLVTSLGVLALAASATPAQASGPDDVLMWPPPHGMHCHMAGDHAADPDSAL
jgi:hypothetical protein